jgi:succinate dehydrogenase/fumarate reductase flavoprotein subunit
MWNVALVSALELANLADQAVVIAHSACERTESRGAHAREDYQKRDDVNWLKHSSVGVRSPIDERQSGATSISASSNTEPTAPN